MIAPTVHVAEARRKKTGWLRWFAYCPSCGYTEWPRVPGGKEAATLLAEAHNARWTT